MMDLTKFLSRKWLMGAVGLILGILVLIGVLTPDGQAEWTVVAEKVVGGLLAVAALLGYVIAEAKVDAARVASGKMESVALGTSSVTTDSRPLSGVTIVPHKAPPPGVGPSRREGQRVTSPFTDDLPHGPPPTGGSAVRPPGATT